MKRGDGSSHARWPSHEILFLKYRDSGTIAPRTLHVTVPTLPLALGRRRSGEGRPMGSTQPPLEFLLKLSHNCLEGFELSRLNRISNLRKEFREVLEEWIELEIEARFARWILEYRHVGDSFPDRTVLPAFPPTELAAHSVTHVSEQFLLPGGDEHPVEFQFASVIEPGDGVEYQLRLTLRHLPVCQDAAAALRSLERFALCNARSIGDQPIDLLACDAPDSSLSCPFLSYSPREPVRELRSVSSPMSCVLAGTTQAVHYIVQYASTFVTSAAPLQSNLPRHQN
jgi:hypothetical protein